jgi:hypothetical protein
VKAYAPAFEDGDVTSVLAGRGEDPTALVRGMNDSGPAAARLRDEERNRLEEVLANMAREGVIVARPTRSGAVQYVPGPAAASYRKAAS